MIDSFQGSKKEAVELRLPNNASKVEPSYQAAKLRLPTKRVLTNLVALAIVGVGISPIAASAAQEDLIVSVADPGIQFYADSGLTTNAPVLVETFENTQFGGDWTCFTPSLDEYGNPRQDEYGYPICLDGDGDGYEDWGVPNPDTLFSLTTQTFESPVGIFTRVGGDVYPANRWGGAGGLGTYAGAGDILLTVSDQSDYRYLGFWWSAGSVGNDVQLLDANNNVLASFTVDSPGTTEDLEGVTSDAAYLHNPNRNIEGGNCYEWSWGRPCWQTYEKYAFVHLRYPPGFRKVRFVSSGNGFEFDNVTISTEVPGFADSETTTETFTPYALSTSALVLADPRAVEISFPGVSLDAGVGESNAMLCISEVADQTGAALTGSPTFQFSDSGSTLTAGGDNSLRTFSGTRTNVESLSSGLVLTPSNFSQSFGVVGSRYLRVTATPQSNAGTAGCTGNATDSEVVEVRFVNMIQRNSFGIQID